MARLDLDQIIKNVSHEAQALDGIVVDNPAPVELDCGEITLPDLAGHDAHVLPIKREYRIEEFLRFDGKAFINNAFRGTLQRDADDAGYACYQDALGRGVSKHYIIADLLMSDEGRRHGVKVRGLELLQSLLRLSEKTGPGRRVVRKLLERCWAVGSYLFSRRGIQQRLTELELQTVDNQSRLTEALNSHLTLMNQRLSLLETQVQRMERQGARVESGVDLLQADFAQSKGDLQRDIALIRRDLQDTAPGAAALLSRLDQVGEDERETVKAVVQDHQLEAYYMAFENACRGTKEEIRENLNVYLPYLGTAADYGSDKLVDLGCGRGEWIELMQEHGWTTTGVDMNQVMVQHCKEQGLEAVQSDALSYLKALPDQSLSILSGFHIIEHLPFDVAFNIFSEAYRVLVPGGRILFETPNPENVLVGSHTFYHDPTHRNPVTPTAVEFLAKYHGFAEAEIIRLHPYPEEAKVPGHDALTERVNGHLCGPQDYALLATKPKDES